MVSLPPLPSLTQLLSLRPLTRTHHAIRCHKRTERDLGMVRRLLYAAQRHNVTQFAALLPLRVGCCNCYSERCSYLCKQVLMQHNV